MRVGTCDTQPQCTGWPFQNPPLSCPWSATKVTKHCALRALTLACFARVVRKSTTIKFSLHTGLHVDCRTRKGMSPLLLAASQGQRACVCVFACVYVFACVCVFACVYVFACVCVCLRVCVCHTIIVKHCGSIVCVSAWCALIEGCCT